MHWAGQTHGSVIAHCIAFIMGPWMGYWYITHKHTYNCVLVFFFFFFLSLFSITFNAALRQNGLRLTEHIDKVRRLAAIFLSFWNVDWGLKDIYLMRISNEWHRKKKTLGLYQRRTFYSIWRCSLFINKWQAPVDKYHFLQQNESSHVHLFTHRHAILKIPLKWHYSRDWNHYFIEQKIAIEFGAK